MHVILGTLIAALALLYCAITPARAHGDATWIMQEPRYVDPLGIHCCGPSDCEPVPDSEIDESQDIITHRGDPLSKRERGVYWSIDDRYWVCRRENVKCIFRPQPGS